MGSPEGDYPARVVSNYGIFSSAPNAINTQVRLPDRAIKPIAQVGCPSGLTNVPVRPRVFVGRAASLTKLGKALAKEGRGVAAVHGLGGVGKSTLAAYWAMNSGLNPVWWIDGHDPIAIDAGLVKLATRLEPLASVLAPDVLRGRAIDWLNSHKGWLVILDNVTAPAYVESLLAQSTGGRFLITTRRAAAAWQGVASLVPLDMLAENEALDLLTQKVASSRSANLDGAAQLCEVLGYLPLAIEQAGAYIAESEASPRTYLELLSQAPARMYKINPEEEDESRTVAQIWDITLGKLSGQPLAGQLLRIMAWFAPTAIPRRVLTALASPPELQDALRLLNAYSMITLDAETVVIHRLVQAVSRTPDPSNPHRQPHDVADARQRATELLAAAAPATGDPRGWPVWRSLVPHIDAIAEHSSPEVDSCSTADLVAAEANFMQDQGVLARAIPLHKRAWISRSRELGSEDPRTLESRHKLAVSLRQVGHLSLAIPLLEASVADHERVSGQNNAATLQSRVDLAFAYEVAGRWDHARPMYRAILPACIKALGEDHPLTIRARRYVAELLLAENDVVKANALFERNLLACNHLGLSHDDLRTLEARWDLAAHRVEPGDPHHALPLLEGICQDCARVLGNDHPATLSARIGLATYYRTARNPDGATKVLDSVLADARRVLGKGDPLTWIACRELAMTYTGTGNREQALKFWEEATAGYTRVLGENHPDTLANRVNHAVSFWNLSLNEPPLIRNRAIQLLEDAYEDCRRVLSENHEHTVSAAEALEHISRVIAFGGGWGPSFSY
jgi:tetratricopeptide (TPR) repeat protein